MDYSRRPPVVCRDPETVGLVQQESGRWGFPIDDDSRARLAALRAERGLAGTTVTPRPSEGSDSLLGAP